MNPLAAAVAYAALLAPAPLPDAFPADPEKAIEKFDKDARAIEKKARDAIRLRKQKLIEHLKKVQADYVKKGKKADAAAVGDYILVLEATAADTATPAVPLKTIRAASVSGKYRRLLKVLHVPTDKAGYTEFRDYGYSATPNYHGHTEVPSGFWVYVHPYWFIWGDQP